MTSSPRVDVRQDLDEDLTEFTVEGPVRPEQLADAVRSFYSGKITALVLWDLRKADFSALDAEHVRHLVELSKGPAQSRAEGRTAFVFSADEGFGLGRMFELLQDPGSPQPARMSFRSLEKAREWLGVG